MKRRIIFALIGFGIFTACFIGSVLMRDYFHDRHLKNNIHKVKVGMTEAQVIEILGKPSHKIGSDEPGNYWSYDTNSFSSITDGSPERIGYLVLKMGTDGKVEKVLDFK